MVAVMRRKAVTIPINKLAISAKVTQEFLQLHISKIHLPLQYMLKTIQGLFSFMT